MPQDGVMPQGTLEWMRERKRELIWNRGPLGEILGLSYQIYIVVVETNPVAAEVERASDYYSLVKRYVRGWRKVVAFHLYSQALEHANVAEKRGLNNPDQIDVVSRIYLKAPWFFGKSFKRRARDIVKFALDNLEMLPHTRALMLITLGEIELALGKSPQEVFEYYKEAEDLGLDIARESDHQMAMRQLARITLAVALFYYDYGSQLRLEFDGHIESKLLLRMAIDLAKRYSADQYQKIADELRKRESRIEWFERV